MAHWTDLATWKGPTPNQGGAMYEWRGLVIHIAEGYLDGTLAWQKNPSAEVSSHFIVGGPRDGVSKDGLCYQVVDTATIAWTQANGNGHWLSIECSGFVPDKLSPNQIEKIAQVLAKCHTVYGVPLQVTSSTTGKGLGHHSMGCNQGWGHCDCPGDNIIAQKQQIVDRAKQIVSGDDEPVTPEEMDQIAAKTVTKLLGTLLGSSGPTVGVTLQSGAWGNTETIKDDVTQILALLQGSGGQVPTTVNVSEASQDAIAQKAADLVHEDLAD